MERSSYEQQRIPENWNAFGTWKSIRQQEYSPIIKMPVNCKQNDPQKNEEYQHFNGMWSKCK